MKKNQPTENLSKTNPIVVIHKHDSFYLPYCLYQAKTSNPRSDIILIGDSNNNHYPSIKHFHISDYSTGIKEFQKVYRHLSTNLPVFELFCFQRWFVLRNFMQAHQLDTCIHIDSDLMVYSDLSQEHHQFSQYQFTLTRGRSGHCSFFNSRKSLEKICDFIMFLYEDPSQSKYLQNYYHQVITEGKVGGVNDMFAFEQYRMRHPDEIGEMATIRNGAVYDCNVSRSDGFEIDSRSGTKRIFWKNGQPYGIVQSSQEQVRFHSLHFQGKAKKQMKRCTKVKPIACKSSLWLGKSFGLLQKVQNRVASPTR
ncbi:MAG: hypothetical protein AAF766_05460 [Cyanobacteria bacterium P01_D01_bin.14]